MLFERFKSDFKFVLIWNQICLPIPSNLLRFLDVLKYIFRMKTKKVLRISVGIRKYGLTTAATTMVPNMLKIFWTVSNMDFDRFSSTELKNLNFIEWICDKQLKNQITQDLLKIDSEFVQMDWCRRIALVWKLFPGTSRYA